MNQTPIDKTGAGRGSLSAYITGFALAMVLTVFAFNVVMSGAVSGPEAMYYIFGAAVAQILVHLHYFLHLDTSSAARWNLMASLMTLLIMVLFVGGTIWIMFHLKERMM
jgi:cytochrome o ubiquinol oxidase subunit IV